MTKNSRGGRTCDEFFEGEENNVTKNLQCPACARQTTVTELRKQGLTFEQIAQTLGISRQSAHRSFKRYLGRGGGESDAEIEGEEKAVTNFLNQTKSIIGH